MARPDRSPFTSATKQGTPPRQAVDDALDGDGLAGAGRARDQAVAIGAAKIERQWLAAARTYENARFACHMFLRFGEWIAGKRERVSSQDVALTPPPGGGGSKEKGGEPWSSALIS
jgi:hypothetical protein